MQMTVPDIAEHVHHSNLIEGFDDPVMDACGVAAWRLLLAEATITPEVIFALHRVVTAAQHDLDDEDRGAWRRCGVCVGTHIAPDYDDVPALVDTWCYALWLSVDQPESPAAFTPCEQHVAFERVHPFVDGNGRVGRLLMWWHEHHLGAEPTLIRHEERHDYYAWFSE